MEQPARLGAQPLLSDQERLVKTITLYQHPNGIVGVFPKDGFTPIEVTYDENAACDICGLPVVDASMSGLTVCPWCDCGRFRDGTAWTMNGGRGPLLLEMPAFLEEARRRAEGR